METTKQNTISDKAEKAEAATMIKNKQSTQFAGKDGKGKVADGYPLAPIGSSIFLKWNLPEDSKIIGVDTKVQKPLSNIWEVIGIGGNVKTVDIGDKVILKADIDIEGFDTSKIEELIDVKYHIIYEHSLSAIVI